ncbi:MAG TPA: enoyl-CoA hydratase-related protein [Acidimicrobiales bacterium]
MSTVVTSIDDRGVMTITLADEVGRNVLSAELVGGVLDAMDAADADDDVRLVVLTNSGSVFCAGADLRSGGVGGTGSGAGPGRNAVDLYRRFRASPKPTIGRIAGHCVAGGMGLAAAMDLAVAIETAKMGFTEVRVGVAPAMISVLCLPKMRPTDAAAAFLRGNRFTAVEAAELGLINAAVAADRLDDEVNAIIDDLLLGGPGALAATKSLLNRIPGMSIDDAFEWTARLSADLFRTDEAREGMAAFVERRSPPWARD